MTNLPTYVLIQRNPRAGARQRRHELLQLVRELKALGFIPRMFRERARLDAWMADADRRSRVRCLVAAGGDGTVNDLLTRFPGMPLAVLPLGTENLLATWLQIPRSGRAVAGIVATGKVRHFDVGRIDDRQFIMCAGVGLDAAIIQAVHSSRAGHITKWNYAWPILRILATHRPCELILRDDVGNEFRGRQVLIFNHPRYALGLQWTADAVGDDGWLDVCVFTESTLCWIIRYLWNGWWRTANPPGMKCLRVRRATITCAEPVLVHVDGDPAGATPVNVEVLPGALTLLLPNDAPAHTSEFQIKQQPVATAGE
jgi:diacylglycerol kinase (ATP)